MASEKVMRENVSAILSLLLRKLEAPCRSHCHRFQ
ncbi:hypothetical protein CsSME_00019811 [Camellia sinensis var. sinensis]